MNDSIKVILLVISLIQKTSLKRKCLHFDEIFITGCTESCQNDNFQCSQWWKFHQNDIFVSVLGWWSWSCWIEWFTQINSLIFFSNQFKELARLHVSKMIINLDFNRWTSRPADMMCSYSSQMTICSASWFCEWQIVQSPALGIIEISEMTVMIIFLTHSFPSMLK